MTTKREDRDRIPRAVRGVRQDLTDWLWHFVARREDPRKTLQTIRFNVALAIAIKLLFIALALIGMSNLALAIFADVGVTLIVILISLQLMKWKPQR